MGVFLDDVVLDVGGVVDWFAGLAIFVGGEDEDGEFFEGVVERGLCVGVPWDFVDEGEGDAF